MYSGLPYIIKLIIYPLPSPSGEDEPRTIAIGGRAKTLRIPLMWNAYMQMDRLLKHEKTDGKTAKNLEGPSGSELASLQV